MKAFSGYENTQAIKDKEALPSGGYIAKIIAAKEVTYDWGSRLEIAVEITEGEKKGYFQRQFDSQTGEDKKWKGVLRQSVPRDDGSEADDWTKRKFKTNIEAIEDSNPGYHWDWDEKKLKDKAVGLLVRQKEWEFGGRTGWAPECIAFTSVQNIRDGEFKLPKDKPLNSSAGFSAPGGTNITNDDFAPLTDDDLPF